MMDDIAAPAIAPPPDFVREQLRMCAASAGGQLLPRESVFVAVRASGGMLPAPIAQRLRAALLDGRQTIFVWPDQAQSLLCSMAARCGAAAVAATPTDPRAALLAGARRAFALAEAMAGPDMRWSRELEALGLQLMGEAARIQAPASEIATRARRLFGAVPQSVLA